MTSRNFYTGLADAEHWDRSYRTGNILVHQTGIFGRFFRILWVKMGSSRVKKEYCG
jgi:hypothetical protein